MNINLTKQYTTRSGLPVKLYDILNNETVTGAYFVSQRNLWIPETWTLSGSYSNEAMFVHDLDLIEQPTHNFVKDQLVLVWNFENETKKIRFLHQCENGAYFTYRYGEQPSYSAHYEHWLNCEPYNPTPESKPLQEGELVVVWNDFRFDNTNFETYCIRRFVSNSTDNIGYVTSTKYVESSNTFIWDNCVRLSEFKL